MSGNTFDEQVDQVQEDLDVIKTTLNAIRDNLIK